MPPSPPMTLQLHIQQKTSTSCAIVLVSIYIGTVKQNGPTSMGIRVGIPLPSPLTASLSIENITIGIRLDWELPWCVWVHACDVSYLSSIEQSGVAELSATSCIRHDLTSHPSHIAWVGNVRVPHQNHIPDDHSFGGNCVVTHSNSLHVGNGFGFRKASGIVRHVRSCFEDILHNGHSFAGSFKEVELNPVLGKLRNSNHTGTRQAPQNPSEMYLQALREFICERHGVLEEGWCVESKPSVGSGEIHVVYHAPDGKTFDSMHDVACYLGLMSNNNSVESKVKGNGSALLQKRSHLVKNSNSMANGATVYNETLSGLHEDLSSDFRTMAWASKFENNIEIMGARPEENTGFGLQELNDSLPVQFEDFFVLSLGKIDTRQSYHNVNQIWPAGYRSCWHDKVTGSLFICDVSNGGDSGPVFKVHRYSCSSLPIPKGSTVICSPKLGQSVSENEGNNDDLACVNMDYDEYCSVQMLLADDSPPKENDILSCLGSYVDKSVQTSDCVQLEGFRNAFSDTLILGDEVGEFSVEASSSCSAWRMVSKTFTDTCRQIYMQRGTFKLFCEHIGIGSSLTVFDCMDEKDDSKCPSLARFCGSSPSIKIPSFIKDSNQLETVFQVLVKWLDQDRFGLDAEFVQEIIEQLPGVRSCLQYVFLEERSHRSSSITVGNGTLLVKTKGSVQDKDEKVLDGLSNNGCRRARAEMVEDPVIERPRPPPGKPISSKLPPEVVGDILQVWEFLWRFYGILGLEDPFPIKELEEDLIFPGFDGLKLLEKVGVKVQESHHITFPTTDGPSHALPSSTESGPAAANENPYAFIDMQTEAMKEATQARMESVTYGRCKGNALEKAHCSLLKVLIGELQSKVSGIIDPNLDTGESKPKRGRKKDMDYSVATKGKLNMLPVNELTWPELARRYILAVLSMNGNADSQDGKVFRCLQGDGGVLCGSLTGVVGMEADALAMKKIFCSLNRENDMLSTDDGGSDATGACENRTLSDNNIPEWAQLLEPVRKLPTNVGARIRKCVNNALEKGPPEWAKKILEHSISKEVYKGNASGPTKKAVLSVLADICGEGMQKKPAREIKRKNFMSISDLIMKQCRLVLRRAAAADNAKVLCNLLGRTLISSNDNDDEGVLGSPAMVSRPLDFRTIDLRLAVGAYGGCHEAFFEDVRELWTHMRIAYRDQPDLVQLVEMLSSNFEALYEEVVCFFQKLVGYAKLGCLTAESKKEIDDFLVSSRELPKGTLGGRSLISYTYCLSPPLASIPQGNWYCPSCVADKHNVRDASECTSVIPRSHKKSHGEVARVYLDGITHLTSVLEQREYWEFSVDEVEGGRVCIFYPFNVFHLPSRMHCTVTEPFCSNFFCDELLNSALIHQHLEHCVELSADLQQKLRSTTVELRNLKYKEETLAANVAKTDNYPPFSSSEEKSAGKNQNTESLDAEDRCTDVQAVVEGSQFSGNASSPMSNLEKDKSFRQNELHESNVLQQETNDLSRENSFLGGMKKYVGKDDSTLPFPETMQGPFPPMDMKSSQIGEHVPSTVLNESLANSLELNSLRNEISLLQGSVSSMEMQLMKLSVRGDFLGSDSAGRLYWALAKLTGHPWVIVNSRETLQQGVEVTFGSRASCPSLHELSDANTPCFPWISYQSEAEIKELVECLSDDDPKERELKESILHWLKVRFQCGKQTENQYQDKPQMASSGSTNKEDSLYSEPSITKAASLFKNRYGPWSEPEIVDFSQKRGRKVKVATDDKIFRCNCLEPVWPSRYHCRSCHRTFSTDVELEGHNDAVCKLGMPVSKKSKGINAVKGKGMMNSEILREECSGDMEIIQPPKDGDELNSKLIKYQNDGLEIGLIGSNGIPMFVPSVSPYLFDPALMLVPPKRDGGVTFEEPKIGDHRVSMQGTGVTTNAGNENSCPRRCATNEITGNFKSDKPVFESSVQKGENSSFRIHAQPLESGNCCVIPQSALRPLVGKACQILRRLKIDLLDMDAALPEAALRPSKAHLERRWAWRAFVKSTETIYEMVQAVIVFEDMIKTEYLRNTWWYWSSLSAAAKISTLSSLALRIYSLDASIDYEKPDQDSSNSDKPKLSSKPERKPESMSDATEKSKLGRKMKRNRGLEV
ncbi:methyl-CPG-binding domain 9 [Actinidia rufa]|uniref:Methyl-CPG-binding domain 9 n=1 Tax=Actinidia rufa TaxID=165716 RepID=A0A7J0ELB7_9ERIC|nr:methyl-CPG-binding domain 9 [Actinidia rufa]